MKNIHGTQCSKWFSLADIINLSTYRIRIQNQINYVNIKMTIYNVDAASAANNVRTCACKRRGLPRFVCALVYCLFGFKGATTA